MNQPRVIGVISDAHGLLRPEIVDDAVSSSVLWLLADNDDCICPIPT